MFFDHFFFHRLTELRPTPKNMHHHHAFLSTTSNEKLFAFAVWCYENTGARKKRSTSHLMNFNLDIQFCGLNMMTSLQTFYHLTVKRLGTWLVRPPFCQGCYPVPPCGLSHDLSRRQTSNMNDVRGYRQMSTGAGGGQVKRLIFIDLVLGQADDVQAEGSPPRYTSLIF